MCVLAGLVALPQSASAQAGEADTTSEPNLQEPAPSSEPAPEEPALQLKLDDAGVEVVPTADGFYILEPTELRGGRARGAKIGLGVSAGFLVVGAVMTAVGFTSFDFESSLAPLWTGVAFMVGGSVGLIVSGVMLRGSNRKPRRQKEAHCGTPRRAQWDLAQSRLVF
jgi:hypothetical protein